MLQAHSLLWKYLWVGPNLLLLLLGFLLLRRGTWRSFPSFLAFAGLSSAGQLGVYVADVLPSVTAANFWRVDWASLVAESLLKFLVIGEVFSRVLSPYPSVSRLGRVSISGLGAALVVVAALVAAYSRGDSTEGLISGAHLLEQAAFMIEVGLVVFLFLLASYFRLSWDRLSFGMLLGLGISACEHLATWAVMANTALSIHERTLLDFLNMATYNVCVLIWCYYLLVPEKKPVGPKLPPANPPSGFGPDDLDLLNQELEQLIRP